MFSKKATKIHKIFMVELTFKSKWQIDGKDFVSFCGLLRKHKLYDGKKFHMEGIWNVNLYANK